MLHYSDVVWPKITEKMQTEKLQKDVDCLKQDNLDIS